MKTRSIPHPSVRMWKALLARVCSTTRVNSWILGRLAAKGTVAVVLVAGLFPVALAMPFDAVPFGLPLPEGNGVMWEDPREIHRVVVQFNETPPEPRRVRIEYWGSWWPERHLPK